jgi:hypothetical protein
VPLACLGAAGLPCDGRLPGTAIRRWGREQADWCPNACPALIPTLPSAVQAGPLQAWCQEKNVPLVAGRHP